MTKSLEGHIIVRCSIRGISSSMSNFIVVSPSLSTNGGNSGDLFVYRSGGINGSTLVGGTGADTVELLDVAASANGLDLNTKGGADVFTISGQTVSGTIKAGAGGDTINFNGANTQTDLRVGDGSDVIALSGALTVTTGGSIQGGAGADIISGAANNVIGGASFLMGAGKDTITFSATIVSGLINMGGGADVVTFDTRDSSNNATIKGGAGGDTIDLAGSLTAGIIQLGDGSDNLTISASNITKTGAILGGAGADIISGNSEVYVDISGHTIGGGAGADTITLAEFGSAGEGGLVLGGGGNDSITLNANMGGTNVGSADTIANFSAGNGYATILGGAGADSITFAGLLNQAGETAGVGYAGVIAYSALSESTEASMDVITYSGSAATTKFFLLDFDATLATGIAASKSKGGITTDANGFLNAAGSNSSVSDLISAVDGLTVTGEIATFKDVSGDAYIFVQGGSTDLVVEFDKLDHTAGPVVLTKEADGEFRVSLGDA